MNVKLSIKKNVIKLVKFIYKMFYKYITVDEKMILFISYHGRGYSCNPKYIHQYLINDSKYSDYKFIWAVKKTEGLSIPKSSIVKYNGFKYYYYLAKSKYWIFNCKMPKHILKKDNQIYLQTWHGTPLKKLAHDIEVDENTTFYRTNMTKEQMTETYDNDVKKYNYFISPNSFSTEKFKSAFRVPEDKIIETGYPRNDFLTNVSKDDILRLKKKYNIPLNKKVILYAPTWRDNSFTSKGYTFELKVDFNLWKKKLGQEYIVIFKPHYLIINKFSNENLEDFLYTVNEDEDINELYVISDMLITDYSSVFFDYAILERPVLFYMYDLEEYRDQLRGFYLDIHKDLPGPIITEEEELFNKIIKNNENVEWKIKLNQFNQKFNYLQDGRCGEKVIESIIK